MLEAALAGFNDQRQLLVGHGQGQGAGLGLVTRDKSKVVAFQSMMKNQLRVHHCDVQSNTFMRATAKGNKAVRMVFMFLALGGEAQVIELIGFGPVLDCTSQ